MLRRTLIPDSIINYQRKRAQARRIVKEAKRKYWQTFCSSPGRDTQLGDVWNMLKKMNGIYQANNIPVLIGEGRTAVTQEEKAELLVQTFKKVYSNENLDGNYRERRKEILEQKQDIYNQKPNGHTALDATFEMFELKRVLTQVTHTAPGQDKVCYMMFKYADEVVLRAVLGLFNKVWIEGKLPREWKHAVIIPIAKPGKDPSVAGNYRPIALNIG